MWFSCRRWWWPTRLFDYYNSHTNLPKIKLSGINLDVESFSWNSCLDNRTSERNLEETAANLENRSITTRSTGGLKMSKGAEQEAFLLSFLPSDNFLTGHPYSRLKPVDKEFCGQDICRQVSCRHKLTRRQRHVKTWFIYCQWIINWSFVSHCRRWLNSSIVDIFLLFLIYFSMKESEADRVMTWVISFLRTW